MFYSISKCYRRFARIVLLVAAAGVPALLVVGAPLPGLAQDESVLRIAAVVNEDVISAYDLNQRVKMVMVTGRVPDTPENRRRLTDQVLHNMIDEQLQLQEAKRLNIRISKQDVDKLLVRLNAQNNLPPGTLESVLRRAGVDTGALRAKVRADAAWNKIVSEHLAQQVIISDDEVDEEMKRLKAVQNLPRHHVAEIFLPVDNPDNEKQVHDVAEKLLQQIRDGANFSALAREFSQSASAAVGGDLGWVTKGQLDPQLDRVIDGMHKGEVAGPVHTLAGFHILLLIDRIDPSASAANVSVDYTQLILPLARNATAADLRTQEQRAAQIRSTVRSCADLRAAAAKLEAPKSGDVRSARLSDLPPAIRGPIEALQVGETSEPVRVAEGVMIATLCDRKGNDPGALPTREQVRQRLGNERFNLVLQRYMRDLRQTAFVDIRG
jgi:peptidyl-prolyl cis-trans isomerase SurA